MSNNNNNNPNANFADFIANPSKAWNTNLPDPREKDNKKNQNLLYSYINLLNLTSSSSRLKRLPKFITYGNAKSHLNEIFIPRIVCLFIFSQAQFLRLCLFFLGSYFLDRAALWLIGAFLNSVVQYRTSESKKFLPA